MHSDEDGGSDSRGSIRPRGRKIAEWVSLLICLLLVGGVAGFLAYEATREDAPYVPVSIEPQFDRVHARGSQYFLPVEVTNEGRRTLQRLKVSVTYRGQQGQQESRDFEIDYLGERASQKIYLPFEQDPRGLTDLKTQPLVYRLDQ